MTIQVSAPLLISYVALWVLVVVQSLILLGMVRVVYQSLQLRPAAASAPGEQLERGQAAPAFTGTDIAGRTVDSSYFAEQAGALLFVSPNCETCSLTLAEMGALRRKVGDRVLVVCRGGREDCAVLARQHELDVPLIADELLEISNRFGIKSVPMAVLIDKGNVIQTYGQPHRDDGSTDVPSQLEEAEGVAAR